MAGNHEGGIKTAETNRSLHPDFYRLIGAAGGKKSRGGGFASNKVGADGLTGRERAKLAGYLGGKSIHPAYKSKPCPHCNSMYRRVDAHIRLGKCGTEKS